MTKLKDSEKNILYVLLIVVILALSFFLGFRNIDKASKNVGKEVDELENKYNQLKDLAAQADRFVKETKEYEENTVLLYNKYDTGSPQEYIVKFLEGIENESNVWLKSGSLTQPAKIFTFGNIVSSNPANPGITVYSTDNVGINTTSNISFSGTYEETKEMIKYILHNDYKCTFENFNASYNADADIVTGTFSVSKYSIEGKDRLFGDVNINNGEFGTDNIFNSSVFNPGADDNSNGENIQSDHDIYLLLQNPDSDVSAFSMGLKDDTVGKSNIVNDDNKINDVTITITGKGNDYKISYKVGNVTYPTSGYADGVSFNPGNMLGMLVASSERDGLNDNVGANITILNESDMTLYIKIINEDMSNPRFKIKHKSGDVEIFESTK